MRRLPDAMRDTVVREAGSCCADRKPWDLGLHSGVAALEEEGSLVALGEDILVALGEDILVALGEDILVALGEDILVAVGEGTLVAVGEGTLVAVEEGNLVAEGSLGVAGGRRSG
jgi:hypothetical protein